MQQETEIIKIFILICTAIILLLITFVVSIMIIYRKNQLNYYKELAQIKNDYEKNLLATQLEIQEQTFQSVSREIHDNINNTLTLAKLQLTTADINNPSKTGLAVNHCIELIGQSIGQLSDISKSLDTEAIETNGLYDTLVSEIHKINRAGQHRIHFICTEDPMYMDAQKELIVFRIAQEALNNIIKHAQATEVEVALTYTNLALTLTVSDNGKGFSVPQSINDRKKNMKAGLNNIAARTRLLGGTWRIDSDPNIKKGTVLSVTIPYTIIVPNVYP
jgi:two-component system, NarL family, sensor kinase